MIEYLDTLDLNYLHIRMVKEPIARVIGEFNVFHTNCKRHWDYVPESCDPDEIITKANFLTFLNDPHNIGMYNRMTKYLAGINNCFDGMEKCFELAKAQIDKAHLVLIFDKLPQSIELLWSLFGISHPTSIEPQTIQGLLYINQDKEAGEEDDSEETGEYFFVDDEVRQAITELNYYDILIYKYALIKFHLQWTKHSQRIVSQIISDINPPSIRTTTAPDNRSTTTMLDIDVQDENTTAAVKRTEPPKKATDPYIQPTVPTTTLSLPDPTLCRWVRHREKSFVGLNYPNPSDVETFATLDEAKNYCRRNQKCGVLCSKEIFGNEKQCMAIPRQLMLDNWEDQYYDDIISYHLDCSYWAEARQTQAVVVYIPGKDRYIQEFHRYLYPSWLFINSKKKNPEFHRTDMLVFCEPSACPQLMPPLREPFSDKQMKIPQTSVCEEAIGGKLSPEQRRTSLSRCFWIPLEDRTAEFYDYRFLNSLAFFSDQQFHDTLLFYDYLLKSDGDVFLPPDFLDWKPQQFTVGRGAYMTFDHDGMVPRMMYDFAVENNWANDKAISLEGWRSNCGSTWYGKSEDIVAIGDRSTVATLRMLEQFHNGKWDSFLCYPFYHGPVSMFGSEVALNTLLPDFIVDSKHVDYSSKSHEELYGIRHIHIWHGPRPFSKGMFAAGRYTKIFHDKKDYYINLLMDTDDPRKITTNEYCMAIALVALPYADP